ncbi:MAG: restriction endonuclease, partial [bacterium]|nr:restriction endonuclease [bacterium]
LAEATMLDIRYELADCYMQDKNFQAAIEQWQEIDAVQPDYRDVRQKIKDNVRFGKDRIQDFIIAQEMDFEKISRYIVTYLDFTIKKLKMNSKEEIMIEARSNSPEMYQGLYYIVVRRSFNPMGEREISEFYNEMLKNKIKRGLVVSATGISPTGIKFSLDKSIDLIGTIQVMRLLKKFEHRI